VFGWQLLREKDFPTNTLATAHHMMGPAVDVTKYYLDLTLHRGACKDIVLLSHKTRPILSAL
jgi:hypothetical protein